MPSLSLDLSEAGTAGDISDDSVERGQCILVRRLCEIPDPRDINTSTPKVVLGTQVGKPIQLLVTADARVGAVLGDDQAVGAQGLAGVAAEDVALDEDVVVGAGVDGLEVKVVVVVVVDVLAAEAPGGAAGALALPAVVVVGDAELERVYLAEDVAVANERRL